MPLEKETLVKKWNFHIDPSETRQQSIWSEISKPSFTNNFGYRHMTVSLEKTNARETSHSWRLVTIQDTWHRRGREKVTVNFYRTRLQNSKTAVNVFRKLKNKLNKIKKIARILNNYESHQTVKFDK